MSLIHIVLGLVALQRLGELVLAARNTRDLRTAGAIELDAGGYLLFVLLHTGWLLTMALLVPGSTSPSWPLLAVFAALQLGRLWVIASLGRYWTTRLIVPAGRPLVRSGPYRFLNHPNYLIVIAEIAVLPLAFGAATIAAVFSAANLVLLARRVAVEERALMARREA
jgi:methyltransferase